MLYIIIYYCNLLIQIKGKCILQIVVKVDFDSFILLLNFAVA